MFSSLLFIFIFYGICFYGIICDNGSNRIISLLKEFTTKEKLIIWGTTIFFLLVILFWPQQNRFIYSWDQSGYWLGTVNRTNYIFNHTFWDNIKSCHYSINNQDYNVFLPTFLALPMSIIGDSFAQYVIINCIMFLLPTYFVQAMLGVKIVDNKSFSKSHVLIISFIIAVLFVGNYFAVFRGYVDVAYLLPMSVVMYLFVDYDFSKINTKRNIAIALNLILIWVCRRYTAYFLIGYVFAFGVKSLFHLATHKDIKTIVINFIQISVISLGILFGFFKQFILHALLTDYAKIYSAYNTPITTKLTLLGLSFGNITIVLVLIVGILCLAVKKQRINYFSLLVLLIVENILFWKTQAMGVQHRMLLNVPIYIIIIMTLNAWNVQNKGKLIANTIIILVFTVIGANFSKSFINDVHFDKDNKLFSEKYRPMVRDDIDKLMVLERKLNELTQGTDKKIYILASSGILNSQILQNLYAPKILNAVPNMLPTYNVDLRDGFPTHFFDAKYIVTTSPIQLHLGKGQQIVIEYLAENVQNVDSYIGKHYKFLDKVQLQNKVVAKIYEKISNYSEDDLQKIRDYTTKIYPNENRIFADRIFIK